MRSLFSHSWSDFRQNNLLVRFKNESGLDYKGLTRELFDLLGKSIISSPLFRCASENCVHLEINPLSDPSNSSIIDEYRFVGRLIGMSIDHKAVLGIYFVPSFYKLLLGEKLVFQDLKVEDPLLYDSLLWIKENDITDLDLGLTFSVNLEDQRSIDLKNEGSHIQLTQENKREYIQLYSEWRLAERTRLQFAAMRNGITDFIDINAMRVVGSTARRMSYKDLELYIGGLREINVKEWKAYTHYGVSRQNNSTHISAQTRRMFWDILENMDQKDLARLLKFATGSSRVPLGGFAAMKPTFHISSVIGWKDNHRPMSHTCFNRLVLPNYTNIRVFKERLMESLLVDDFGNR
ncbi:MAG: hypothetical protein SGCHY_003280 [Lobulomycetales sp.]